MAELSFLIDQLRRIYEGEAWHGPSLRDALSGLSATQAAARPLPHSHSIGELTHHVTAWIGEVTRRLQGGPPAMPVDGDFPPPGTSLTETEWSALLARLAERQASLLAAAAAFGSDRLGEKIGATVSAPLGTGVSYRGMLYGLVQHTAYHAGQIMLLRRAIGA